LSKEVVIVSACRTPVGSFNGTLKDMPVADIGKIAMEEAVKRAGIEIRPWIKAKSTSGTPKRSIRWPKKKA
jgi:acetyl-CoA acetyltransferase